MKRSSSSLAHHALQHRLLGDEPKLVKALRAKNVVHHSDLFFVDEMWCATRQWHRRVLVLGLFDILLVLGVDLLVLPAIIFD